MARRTKEKQRTQDKQESEEKRIERTLRPETKHGILAVVFLGAAIVSVLSFMGMADVVGQGIDNGLTTLFGWGKYVVPVFFAVLGWMFWKSDQMNIKPSNWIGFVIFLFSYSAFLHLIVEEGQAFTAITEGRGGGYIGIALSYPLRVIMGPWATGVVLVGLTLIALLLWFDTSLPELAESGNIVSRIMSRFRRFKERLQRNWTMRSLDQEENIVDDAEAIEEPVDEEQEGMTEEVASTIQEAEEKLKKQAEAHVEKFQKPLIQKKFKGKPYPIDLLLSSTERPTSGDIESNKEIIQNTLETFGISVTMGDISVGPTVTQYTLRPAEGVKLAQITTLANDLALALAAHPIRIEAPIPGKSLVGIEVPNQAKATVKLRDVLESSAFKKRETNLSFALGKDVAGTPLVASLDRMPHMLIAGATGSGKSVCINSVLLSLLYTNTPDTLRLIVVDPKRVELTPYHDIPHLLTPVITTVEKTIHALRWLTVEMDKRFKLFEETGKRNIVSYNEAHVENALPYIVVIIDELADLMAVAASEVEGVIIRLAQMARAVGIHLVVATQRPSVDVITGLIKANITSRIAFSVASGTDSRTILDTAGAEKLLGRGDMLFTSAELSKPKRIQGTFITDAEIEAVTMYLRQQGKPDYTEAIVEKQGEIDIAALGGDPNDDELYEEAKDLVVRAGKASASYLQRRLRIGYARAARLLDLLEEHGVIGPGDGAKAREVYGQTPRYGEIVHETDDEVLNEEEEPEETADDEDRDERV